MKLKITTVSILGCTLLSSYAFSSAPHPWVSKIVDEIKQHEQSYVCRDGGPLRKNHKNCATTDGAAIAKILCMTHDSIYREGFEKGQCGTKAMKQWGGVDDVGAYFEKAIDMGKPDALALACGAPMENLRGKLKEVAAKKCQSAPAPSAEPQATPVTQAADQKVDPEVLKKGSALMLELEKVLKDGPKLKPVNRRMSVGGDAPVLVDNMPISVPQLAMPEISTPAVKEDLAIQARALEVALKNLRVEMNGGNSPAVSELPAVVNLETNISKSANEQDVVNVVKTATAEILGWTSGKTKRDATLAAMRNREGLFLNDN